MDTLREIVLDSYDQMIGLDLSDVAVDGCITKAPCGGQKAGKSPLDRGKQGIKRSTVVDANGVPIGAIAAPANRHDFPASGRDSGHYGDPRRATRADERSPRSRLRFGGDPREVTDPWSTSGDLRERQAGSASGHHPLAATKRWVVERTNSWSNAHKKLVWCTEREGRVIDFWLAFSAVIITVGRLVRQAWSRYRWEGRPRRRP
jgi:hypothetical protein